MTAQPLISVVDDDEGVRRSLDGLVRSLGYRVEMFDSAESFLGSHCATDSQCVISDVQMPGGMSGIELTQTMGDRGVITPVILISAFADDKVRTEAREAGAHCFLKKPFDGEALIACLDKALEG